MQPSPLAISKTVAYALDVGVDLLTDGTDLAERSAAGQVGLRETESYPELDDALIAELVRDGSPAAFAYVTGLDLFARGPLKAATAEAVARFERAGLAAPPWAEELRAPLVPREFRLVSDPSFAVHEITATFDRAGVGHSLSVLIDHLRCHEIRDVIIVPADEVPDLHQIMTNATEQMITAEEFQWQAASALRNRRQHFEQGWLDEEECHPGGEDFLLCRDDTVVLSRRLELLPVAGRAPRPHDSSAHASP